MNNIIYSSAIQILENIKAGKWTCLEVTSAFLERIEQHNDTINAISDLRPKDELLAEAKEKDRLLKNGFTPGPLHGLPMTVKDSFSVKGLISSNGNPQLKNNIADDDAALINRLKRAGAIIMGKSNIALYALDWQTDNAWFGRTNNPYNLNKIVGGSSGGSAAAVAAGFSPLELGTDAGGSIRVPAHFCGVCGIRTTESALPNRGNSITPGLPKLARYLTSNGGMAKNIDDLLLLTEILWSGNHYYSEIPPVPFKNETSPGIESLKIAFSKNLGEHELSNSYSEVYDSFIKKLKTRYNKVVESHPEYDEKESTLLWGKIAGFDFAAAFKNIPFKAALVKGWIKSRYKHKLWAKGMSLGAGSSAFNYAQSLEEKDALGDKFNAFFNKNDIWITPVSISEAIDHQKTGKPIEVNNSTISYADAFIPYNFPTTIPGHPIVVIPIGLTKDGLPVGIQIHGKKWEDYRLLRIAKELESLTEGFIPPKF